MAGPGLAELNNVIQLLRQQSQTAESVRPSFKPSLAIETPDVDIDNTGKPYPITDELLICLLLLVFIIAIESKLND